MNLTHLVSGLTPLIPPSLLQVGGTPAVQPPLKSTLPTLNGMGFVNTLHDYQAPLLKTGGLLAGALVLNQVVSRVKKQVVASERISKPVKTRINTALTGAELAFDAGVLLYVLDSWKLIDTFKFLNEHLPQIGKLGALGLGGFLLYRMLSAKQESIAGDASLTERARKVAQTSVKVGQTAIASIALLSALNLMGIDVSGTASGVAILTAGVGFAFKDGILNLMAYLWHNHISKRFEIGDYITINGKSGIVREVGALCIWLKSFDEFGDREDISEPTSSLFGQAIRIRAKHPDLIATIQSGDYICLKGKRGKVASINDQMLIIETVDSQGIVVSEPIDLYDVNPDTFKVRNDIKELVATLKPLDNVTIGDKIGRIVEVKEPVLVIETLGDSGYKKKEVIDLNNLNPLTFTNYGRDLPPLPQELKAGDTFELEGKKYQLMDRPDAFMLEVFPLNEDGKLSGNVILQYIPVKDLAKGFRKIMRALHPPSSSR